MPISLSTFDDQPLCFGHTWQITDEDKLAYFVSRLLIGRSNHVRAVLEGKSLTSPNVSSVQFARLQAKLVVPPGNDVARWHRDGWLFQMVSWLAAHKVGEAVIIRVPQPRTADKGFDGVILELRENGTKLSQLLICEDKATEDARGTIRDKVWPEIREIESGARDNELVSEVTAMLGYEADPLTVERIIEEVYWKERRAYRVCVTVAVPHDSRETRTSLFGGYDSQALGDHSRRRGETVCLPGLRNWMEEFSGRVLRHLMAIKVDKDV